MPKKANKKLITFSSVPGCNWIWLIHIHYGTMGGRLLLVSVSFLLSTFNFAFGADNVGFASTFYTTKGNLAVVIDQDYIASFQINILRDVKKIVEDTVRENLLRPTVVGIEVKYFPWSAVTLKKGE